MQVDTFLSDLISIPSPTGDEQHLADFLVNYLQEAGAHVALQSVQGHRCNVYARFGESPQILLTTHLDTVPPHIPFRRDGSSIYGRGACDAKGALAAMVAAALALPAEQQQHIALLFVVGEETDSIGAKAACAGGLPFAYIINGEPTENKLAGGQKGIFFFRLHAEGRAAHSGYPEYGDSAIARLVHQLRLLRNLDWGRHPDFGKATFNIGTLHGGSAPNVIAATAEAECAVRVVTDCADVEARLQAVLQPGVRYETIGRSEPVALFVPPGFDSEVVKFGSDAAHYAQHAPVLMLGPGSIRQAHTAQEYIDLRDVHDAVRLYQELIRTLIK